MSALRKRPLSEEAMRLRMADLCSRTEQCADDLRKKMRRAGMSADATERILDFLTEQKFLDEARFARAFARDKVRFAGWGSRKIRMALIAKHLSPADIAEGLVAIDRKDYIDALKRAALAKSRTLDLTDYADIQKLYRHLASKGFEPTLITRLTDYLRTHNP